MDTQPQEPQSQPTPDQVHVSSEPPQVTGPSHFPKKKLVIIGIAVAVLLCVAVGLAFTAFRSDKEPSTAALKKTFPDWLKPSQEVEVGNSRYVSPCQVLNKDNIAELFGGFGGEGYVQEEFQDVSLPEDESELRTRCVYQVDNSSIESVEITATQYRDGADVKQLSRTMSLNDPEDAAGVLAQYKEALGTSDNADAKRLIDRYEKSVATYKEYERVYDEKKLSNLKTDGLLVPSKRGTWLHYGNGVYQLNYKSKGSLTKDRIKQELERFMNVVEAAEANLANKDLSQSPAPTILGETNKVDSTLVLEPCAILTNEVYTRITSRPVNDTIHRMTTVADLKNDRYRPDKSLMLPYNSCERRYNRHNDPAAPQLAQNITIRFTIDYTKNEQAAKDHVAKYYRIEAGDTELQTEADWAAEQKLSSGTNRYYYFRIGAYFASVGIDTLQSEGLQSEIIQGQASREQHVLAINELTRALKAHLEAVQKQ